MYTYKESMCKCIYIYTKADIYIYTYLCIGTQYTIKGNCFLMKNCKLENALNLYIYIYLRTQQDGHSSTAFQKHSCDQNDDPGATSKHTSVDKDSSHHLASQQTRKSC